MSPQSGLNCGLPALHALLPLSLSPPAHSLFLPPCCHFDKNKDGLLWTCASVYGSVCNRAKQQRRRTLSAYYFKASLLSKVTSDSLSVSGWHRFVPALEPNNDLQPWNMVLNCAIINNRVPHFFSEQFLIPLLRINWLNGSLKSLSPLASSPARH